MLIKNKYSNSFFKFNGGLFHRISLSMSFLLIGLCLISGEFKLSKFNFLINLAYAENKIINFSNGDVYVGGWENGRMSGKGTYYFASG